MKAKPRRSRRGGETEGRRVLTAVEGSGATQVYLHVIRQKSVVNVGLGCVTKEEGREGSLSCVQVGITSLAKLNSVGWTAGPYVVCTSVAFGRSFRHREMSLASLLRTNKPVSLINMVQPVLSVRHKSGTVMSGRPARATSFQTSCYCVRRFAPGTAAAASTKNVSGWRCHSDVTRNRKRTRNAASASHQGRRSTMGKTPLHLWR